MSCRGDVPCKCPANEKIIQELKNYSRERVRAGAPNAAMAASKAINSVRSYQLPIATYETAISLQGVGSTLAARIMRVIAQAPPEGVATQKENSGHAGGGGFGGLHNSRICSQGEGRGISRSHSPVRFSAELVSGRRALTLCENTAANRRCHSRTPSPSRGRAVFACPSTYSGGFWRAMMLLDHREKDADAVQARLAERGVPCEVRQLPLGDMIWIAKNSAGVEVLMGYIVERKTAHDLARSVIDSRCEEQNKRLVDTGMGRVIYLVEGGLQSNQIFSANTLREVLSKVQLRDGFTVWETENLSESTAALSLFHKHISERLRSACMGMLPEMKPLMSMQEYRSKCIKGINCDVRTVFGLQLAQLEGCGTKNAEAILQKYPTPSHLMLALERCGPLDKCLELLEDVSTAAVKLKGPLRRSLVQLYCEDSYQ